jgi:hypothetical protein
MNDNGQGKLMWRLHSLKLTAQAIDQAENKPKSEVLRPHLAFLSIYLAIISLYYIQIFSRMPKYEFRLHEPAQTCEKKQTFLLSPPG